jgi:hypothetical protein
MEGHHPRKIKERHPIRTSRIDALLVHPQRCSGYSACLDEFYQISERPTDTVNRPKQHLIQAALLNR